MAARLFEFTFESPLQRSQILELKSVTGMRIGDTHNPYKDTPGNGSFAGNALLSLGRGPSDDTWYLRAFSHDVSSTDLSAVAALREHLRQLLPTIAVDWEETYTYPDLIEMEDRTQKSQEKVRVSPR